jgi:hypothetical protein
MKSAFGVEHDSISKAERPNDTMDDVLTPVLPGSTVRAYDNSRRNKRKAATENFAMKTGGALAGAGLGTLAAIKTKGRIGALNKPTVLRGRELSPHMKQGYYASLLGTGTAGVTGGTAGNVSLHRIKNDPEYKYKER